VGLWRQANKTGGGRGGGVQQAGRWGKRKQGLLGSKLDKGGREQGLCVFVYGGGGAAANNWGYVCDRGTLWGPQG